MPLYFKRHIRVLNRIFVTTIWQLTRQYFHSDIERSHTHTTLIPSPMFPPTAVTSVLLSPSCMSTLASAVTASETKKPLRRVLTALRVGAHVQPCRAVCLWTAHLLPMANVLFLSEFVPLSATMSLAISAIILYLALGVQGQLNPLGRFGKCIDVPTASGCEVT